MGMVLNHITRKYGFSTQLKSNGKGKVATVFASRDSTLKEVVSVCRLVLRPVHRSSFPFSTIGYLLTELFQPMAENQGSIIYSH